MVVRNMRRSMVRHKNQDPAQDFRLHYFAKLEKVAPFLNNRFPQIGRVSRYFMGYRLRKKLARSL